MRMRLSQGQLNLLEVCPRRFQHTYLDQLSLPISAAEQASLHWGQRFHRLMQQRELGLAIDSLFGDADAEAAQMRACIQALIAAAPELFERGTGFRQSEHRRSLEYRDYGLTVIYDLLVLEEEAQILDWKTYPRPPHYQHLARNWQTRLYLFVLAETSDYAPEQISMTYWFVQAQGDDDAASRPQCLRFPYSSTLHQETRRSLDALLAKLSALLDAYEAGELFPQADATNAKCGYCHFITRCQREVPLAPSSVSQISLSAIAETALG